jgi:cytochrome c oxidase cbb3-type subunit 4
MSMDMGIDMEWVRSMMTLIAFATFIGIVVWAWSARKRNDFEAAARSVLAEEGGDRYQQGAMNRRGGNE